MSKYSLQYDSIHSVRLEVVGNRGLDTTVRVCRPVGGCVAVHFGASRTDSELKEGILGVENVPTGEEDIVAPFPAEPGFLRYAIYEGPVATGSSLVRRSGRYYLSVRSILGLVDGCIADEGESPVLHPGVVQLEVFVRGQRVAGARTAALARNGGLLARTVVFDVYNRIRTEQNLAREAEVKEADLNKLVAAHVPLWAVKGPIPKVDIIGEGPVKESLTVRSEARQPFNTRSFQATKDYVVASVFTAKEVLAPVRTQAKYSNLDLLFAEQIVKQKANVVVGIGITSGALAKSLPECFMKGVSFVGILKHGNADRVDNVILPKDMAYSDPKILGELLSFLGKSKDQIQVLGMFYEALDDDIINVGGEYKLDVNAKNRVAAANGLVNSLKNVPFFVRVEDPAAVDLAADWCSRIYWPRNFSLVHPFFYIARIPEGWEREDLSGPTVLHSFEGKVHEGIAIEALIIRLRLSTRYSGDVEGFEYPLQPDEGGGGSAGMQSFMQPNPNLAGQDALTTRDFLKIATRLGALHEMCKRSEPGYGFKDQGSSSVPLEYFNSTYVSKYIWEVAGQQAPTHRALRVAPLAALFPILDDDIYRGFCLLVYVLFSTCAPLHSYELQQRITATGFMTRLEALRRLRIETKMALEGSGGERTVSRSRVTERDAQAYAKELLVFKDTFVTKKTWAVIGAFSRVGARRNGAKTGSVSEVSTSGAEGQSALWQAYEEPKLPELEIRQDTARTGGRGRAGYMSRVYRGGRGRGALSGQPL